MSRFLLRACRLAALALSAGVMAADNTAGAKEPASAYAAPACLPDGPDSVQISWNTPCQSGSWLMDSAAGCRMWDCHPAPEDTAIWTGVCRGGVKVGRGMVQWFEHGRPIDRFEGTFVAGRREGRGRYVWNDTDWYEGSYGDDLPHGPGTAHIAGEVCAGQWKHGCLTQSAKVVAIGVPRKSCEQREERNVGQAGSRTN